MKHMTLTKCCGPMVFTVSAETQISVSCKHLMQSDPRITLHCSNNFRLSCPVCPSLCSDKKRSLAGLTCAHRGLSIDICTLVRNHTLADAKLLNKAVITDGPSRMPRSPSLPSLMTIQNLKHRRGKICPFLFEDIPRCNAGVLFRLAGRICKEWTRCWARGVQAERRLWSKQAWTTPSRSRIKSHQG